MLFYFKTAADTLARSGFKQFSMYEVAPSFPNRASFWKSLRQNIKSGGDILLVKFKLL